MVSAVEDMHERQWILLPTSPGERVMVPEFDCALRQMVFENLDATMMIVK
jgi:phage baseplate assembly protein W